MHSYDSPDCAASFATSQNMQYAVQDYPYQEGLRDNTETSGIPHSEWQKDSCL